MNNKLQRTKNGKTFTATYKTYKRRCQRCDKKFETIWIRSFYCGKTCYMKGVIERQKIWKKTKEGAAWYKEYSVDRFRRIRIQAIMKLGGCCKSCGYNDIRSLHIDHVHGDGKAERGIRKTIYNRIVTGKLDISRYQLLCANCNWIKRLEQNEGSNRKDYNEFMLIEMKKIVPKI